MRRLLKKKHLTWYLELILRLNKNELKKDRRLIKIRLVRWKGYREIIVWSDNAEQVACHYMA